MMQPRKIDLPDDAPHVLVVDDDRRLRNLLAKFLSENGFRITAAASAAEARSFSGHFVFDALVLDVMMPGENGFDFARWLRQHSQVPILMLTARADAQDRVTGLEIGADDYLSKPFEPRELVLRLTNILKRGNGTGENVDPDAPEFIRFGPFIYYFARGELRHGEDSIRLTEREREIMNLLGQRCGGHVHREELAGSGAAANERTVDVQINRLRRKIERDPANPVFLQTVRGIGYRLVVER
jgi:two-component system, OmpR family, phosphate regulon response regulator OmpR